MGLEHRGAGRPNTGVGFTRKRTTWAKKCRKRQENDPWALEDKTVHKMLLEIFPKLQTNVTQRRRAALWNEVVRLYFRGDVAYSNKDVAEELTYKTGQVVSAKQVSDIVCRLQRVARGLRADGNSRTGRKRGRPKKKNNIGVYF